jgi:sulfate/thiosulfate transport system substrate-binding protein
LSINSIEIIGDKEMNKKTKVVFVLFCIILSLLSFHSCSEKKNSKKILLNVSYDPTREMYQDYNAEFIKYWKNKYREQVDIRQSHGGSGKQARSVIDGLDADIVTLALAYDIDEISNRTHKLNPDWQSRLPNNSCPYTSTIVFLVRKGNPKNIKDWNDLINSSVSVITPNPKTSGGARWNYLAAWIYASRVFNNDLIKIKEFMIKLFKNVPVLDTGARGSTNTFVQRGIGDVLIAWENEALLVVNNINKTDFEIVVPSISIIAEPPVALVDSNASKKGNLKIADEYLRYLYSDIAQEITAKHFFRPVNSKILAKYESQYPKLELVSLKNSFGTWEYAQNTHFKDGGCFDEILLGK